jgi:hypothetical protein
MRVEEKCDHRMSERPDTRVGSEIIIVWAMGIVWELGH